MSDLDALLDELKNSSTLVVTPSTKEVNIDDENINEYILKKSTALIEGGLDTINVLKEVVMAGHLEAEEVSSYAELYKAVTGAIDALNKINIQNKKNKNQKEIKQMEIESKNKLPGKVTNNNILIATREEIFKKFLEDNKKAVDTTWEEHEQTRESETKSE